jgi:hypothetical protein
MKSPLMKFVGMAVWFLTALAALHVGMRVMGWNMLDMPMLMPYSHFVGYIFGIAGLVSMVMFFMHLSKGCEDCKCM